MGGIVGGLTGISQEGSFIMREPPDYEGIEQRLWRANAEEVYTRLMEDEPNILKRISTFIWRFGYDEDEVREKIYDDKVFASWFAKEPRRQGLHEAIAADWLNQEELTSDFDTLPKGGPNAYYVTSDGEIRKGMQDPPGKSIDFMWRTGNTDFFAYHKYTKEGGGNQDSQYKEMRDALGRFQSSGERGKALLVIVDGPYYTPAKMSDLERFVRDRPPRSFACQIEQVPAILAEYT